ncbi:MAG: hypothetical protein PHR68_03075 [Candidatus Gracilibacteria bacterium]|nr:hypothetical protein [Candidatus Gracilibacteria bacterium]
MKEKIIKFIEYIEIKNIKRKLCILFILIISLYGLVFIYSLIFEQEKMAIDRYNFQQSEKVKEILDNSTNNSKKFYTLKNFNKIYKTNIEPIKNCYYISNDNGDEKYIFGFKLESKIYIFMYFGENYAYPKYDLLHHYICGGSKDCKDDINYNFFDYTITNPCED